MGLGVGCQEALIQSREQDRSAHGLAQPAHVATSKLNRSQRAGKRGLAWRKSIVTDSYWRKARHGNCSRRNISSAPGHFETETIGNIVSFRLMHLDQHVFIALISNRLPRAHARPIENIQII